IDLYKKGIINKILISGGPGNLVFRDQYEAVLLKEFLLSIDIPEAHILVDSVSDNTHENAVFSANIIKQELNEGKYLLITSSIHMKRAKACFKKEGIIVDIYPTNKHAGPRRFQLDHLFLPDHINLLVWDKLIHEVLGYIVYDVIGYI
ncbi:MAG: YdcF family protein, partial [Bacteroidales bacterium]|nr:YdcF family protein [Bacteroidales bacterium]